MMTVSVSITLSILKDGLVYILFVKTSRSAAVSSALSTRVRKYCR